MSRGTNRFRPLLEFLDARVVPAYLMWTGEYSTDATDARNWWEGASEASAPPATGDTLTFGATALPYSQWRANSCEGLSGSFAGVSLTSSYSGTVTFGGSVSASTFDLEGGAISQPTTGTDLTVTSSFNWTGGTLNSSTNLASVTITGSTTTATIAPANGGTVDLGSTLNLSGGAVATMNEGTLNVTNDGTEFNINANSGMLVDPGAGRVASIKAIGVPGGAKLNLQSGSSFQVESGDYTHEGSVYNAGGSFILESDTTATIDIGDATHVAAFLQTAGATYIAADATFYLNVGDSDNEVYGMLMRGGLLSIKAGTQPQNFVAHIVGALTVDGGDIRFESLTGDTHTFGTFIVLGNVTWDGGTYHSYVSADSSDDSDVWRVTGTFSISGTAAVDVTAVDGENNVVTPDSNMEWFVLRSDTSITAANNTPSLTSGYSFDKDPANPGKWWMVKKN